MSDFEGKWKTDYGAAHFNLAALLLKRGQKDEALVHLRHAIRLNPSDRGAQWLLDQVLNHFVRRVGMNLQLRCQGSHGREALSWPKLAADESLLCGKYHLVEDGLAGA